MPMTSAMNEETMKTRVECSWPKIEKIYYFIDLYRMKNVNPHNIEP